MPTYHNQNPLFSVAELSNLTGLVPQSINRRIKAYKEANNVDTLGRISKEDQRVWVYSTSEIGLFLEDKYYTRFKSAFNEPNTEPTLSVEPEVMPTTKMSISADLPSHLTVNHTPLTSVRYSTQDMEETALYAHQTGNTLAANLTDLITGYTAHKAHALKTEIDATFETIRTNALGKSLEDTVKSISQ